VAEHVYGPGALTGVEEFREQLASASFDRKRLELEPGQSHLQEG
jgi:hypothetical protein